MTAHQGTQLIADQIFGLLQQLDHATYTRPMTVFHGSTVGQHMRHILEFYVCLLEGIAKSRINYGSRRRSLLLASNIEAASTVLEYICETSVQLDEGQALLVHGEFGEGSVNLEYASSVGRELQYAFDHAVHHLAIIRIGLELNCPHIACDAELGIAPSTIKYHKEKSAPAPVYHLSETFLG